MKMIMSKMLWLTALLCFLLFCSGAQSEEISGMWGTCPWRIDNGTLIISAGTGSDTGGVCPWFEYERSIKSMVMEPGVILPEGCSFLCALEWDCRYIDLSGADSSNVTNMYYLFPNIFFSFKVGKHFSFINQTDNMLMVDDAFRVFDWGGKLENHHYDYMNLHVWKTSENKPIKPRQIATERNGNEDTYRMYSSFEKNVISLPYNLRRIESKAFVGVKADVIELPLNLEYIANDAFSTEYVIFLNGDCNEYTWQWAENHPELFIEFVGNG